MPRWSGSITSISLLLSVFSAQASPAVLSVPPWFMEKITAVYMPCQSYAGDTLVSVGIWQVLFSFLEIFNRIREEQ